MVTEGKSEKTLSERRWDVRPRTVNLKEEKERHRHFELLRDVPQCTTKKEADQHLQKTLRARRISDEGVIDDMVVVWLRRRKLCDLAKVNGGGRRWRRQQRKMALAPSPSLWVVVIYLRFVLVGLVSGEVVFRLPLHNFDLCKLFELQLRHLQCSKTAYGVTEIPMPQKLAIVLVQLPLLKLSRCVVRAVIASRSVVAIVPEVVVRCLKYFVVVEVLDSLPWVSDFAGFHRGSKKMKAREVLFAMAYMEELWWFDDVAKLAIKVRKFGVEHLCELGYLD
ncbi:hypothetical protein V8G54_030689 [Vigna mungo]|uniref:Uncharacterized protein n=1 Tax=Vigna mungo TaxID=3915 RepID=A0AAQ3RKB8_VIGMU